MNDLIVKNGKIKKERKLNLKQELFCNLYVSDLEVFGNGAESYLKAYNLSRESYNSARVNASKLLTKSNISQRINELLQLQLNDNFVDKELAFTISQKSDLHSKVMAIQEYNRLKRRIQDKIIDARSIVFNISDTIAKKNGIKLPKDA